MAEPRAHLDRAPIIEAVIDFRVSRNIRITSEAFAHLVPSSGSTTPPSQKSNR